ncbi:MAG: hypothetical protein GWP19_11535 [Planctomycetia bacterium]|nr:hypothetical protein [Planctomycetia bacterium]
MNSITVALIALVSGAIGSLIAPWVKWGIEKKKILLDERKNTIKEVRKLVIEENKNFGNLTKNLATGKLKANQLFPDAITYFDTLNRHSIFHKIVPFLEENTLTVLRNSELFKLKDRGTDLGGLPTPFQNVLDNLSKIEREWGLF